MTRWKKADIIALASAVVAVLACLATFVVPEVRRFIGLEGSDATPTFTLTNTPASPTHAPTSTNTPVPPTPTPPPTCAIGDTWTRPIDGMVMVCVPAGEFLMGSGDDDPEAEDNEKPQHTVYLDTFWIDKTEVTNAQYRKCVEAGACERPGFWDNDSLNAPEQPVVGVSWYDARDYAAWVGGRLPTEAEWEKAARGTDGRIYPWGNAAPDCSRANYRDCAGRPVSADSFPAAASPYGALDMAGNVFDWCQSLHKPYPYAAGDGREDLAASGERVLRGGSWRTDPAGVRCASRYWFGPTIRDHYYGIRVARGFLD